MFRVLLEVKLPFPMTPPVLLFMGRLEVTLPCSYPSTCFYQESTITGVGVKGQVTGTSLAFKQKVISLRIKY